MKNVRKYLISAAIILSCITAAAYPEPNEPSIPVIEFELAKRERSQMWPARGFRGGSPRATHVGVVFLRNPGELDYVSKGVRANINSAIKGSISVQQELFNARQASIRSDNWPSFVSPPGDTTVLTVAGVSLQDTKDMVQAVIKWANDKAFTAVPDAKARRQEYLSRKLELDNKLASLERETQDNMAKLDTMKTTLFYQDVEDARTAIRELNKTRQTLAIEIAGITAKLDATNRYAVTIEGRTAFPDSLKQMRMTEEIELAGALKRKDAVQSALEKANSYIFCTENVARTQALLAETREKVSQTEELIKLNKDFIAEPAGRDQPVEVVGKVIIYHVKK